jgi:transcriptional regulator with XRE-family HTH domain
MLDRQKYEYLRSELKKSRLGLNLLQADLAKLICKPQSFISKVESGERNLDIVEFIAYCKGLGIEPSKFLKKLTDKF